MATSLQLLPWALNCVVHILHHTRSLCYILACTLHPQTKILPCVTPSPFTACVRALGMCLTYMYIPLSDMWSCESLSMFSQSEPLSRVGSSSPNRDFVLNGIYSTTLRSLVLCGTCFTPPQKSLMCM